MCAALNVCILPMASISSITLHIKRSKILASSQAQKYVGPALYLPSLGLEEYTKKVGLEEYTKKLLHRTQQCCAQCYEVWYMESSCAQ
jgi:hypothetical protein